MRVLATVSLSILLFALAGCGGSASPQPATGVLTGNWQINLVQSYPRPTTQLSASGFLVQSQSAITGSVQGPATTSEAGKICGGVGQLSGSVSGSNVSFTLNPGGISYNFTGTISSGSPSMSGSYEALPGVCFLNPTSGTWTATPVPALSGNFTGTLSNSQYMTFLNGGTAAPIPVSGSLTQGSNLDGSSATLTGTITATGYPCFTTAYLSGTISGQNVYLNVFNYSGVQIGTLGVPGVAGIAGTPATVVFDSTGLSLVGTGQNGLSLGTTGVFPCPPLSGSGLTADTTDVQFTFH